MVSLLQKLRLNIGADVVSLIIFLGMVIFIFSLAAPQFLTTANIGSIAFQLPELGLLTLAMLIPIITGGLNLAITYTANISGLTLAWILQQNGGVDASIEVFVLACIAAMTVGALSGLVMGIVVAYTGSHPILVSLAMMFFLRGLGEFLTRGGDISGFPEFIQHIGHGLIFGIPVPLIYF